MDVSGANHMGNMWSHVRWTRSLTSNLSCDMVNVVASDMEHDVETDMACWSVTIDMAAWTCLNNVAISMASWCATIHMAKWTCLNNVAYWQHDVTCGAMSEEPHAL